MYPTTHGRRAIPFLDFVVIGRVFAANKDSRRNYCSHFPVRAGLSWRPRPPSDNRISTTNGVFPASPAPLTLANRLAATNAWSLLPAVMALQDKVIFCGSHFGSFSLAPPEANGRVSFLPPRKAANRFCLTSVAVRIV